MHRFIARARDRAGAERGFYMVWFAITFVALMGFAALALEYNRWNGIAAKAQKAADAAALAGAVFLPQNLNNKAFTTAQSTASENGFTNGSNGVVVTTAIGALANQLVVTVKITTHNPFAQVVGYNNETIVRTAVGEYQLPQNLGSPQNTYGNDPESAQSQPQFWGNIFGPSSVKSKGDAIQSAGPHAASGLCDSDNCPGGVNADYSAKGYFYGIDVPAGTTGPLNIQVFDPAFVHVGDNCASTDGNAANSLNAAAALTAAQIPGYSTISPTIPPSTRYASSGSSAYCTGDMYYGDGSNTANPSTVWTVRSPDDSTYDPTNNPAVCQSEFPGVYPETSNNQPNGTISSSNLATLLESSANYPGTSPAMPFNQFFRQWVTICSIPNPTAGTYYLQVETATNIDGTAAPNGGGANRYALKVGVGSNYSSSNGIRLYAWQTMGIYANATGADTRFYLTRVPSSEAGHILVVEFFDVGDASQNGTISVLPPPDSNVAGGKFSSCTYTAPPGNSTGPPWGTLTATSSGCAIAVSNAGFNAQWVTAEVPIPANYTCTDGSPTGCWTRLEYSYGTGTTVNDTTTWQAYILGDPVRLVH
jgi:hypothetical protein